MEIDLDLIQDDIQTGVVPKGTYSCIVESCNLLETKAGGKRVEVTYKIVEGEHQNRRVWDSLNVVHTNPKVVDIGLKGIKRLATALGISGKISSPSDLATGDKIVSLTIDVQSSEGYGDQNVVKRVLGGAQAPQRSQSPVTQVSDEAAPF